MRLHICEFCSKIEKSRFLTQNLRFPAWVGAISRRGIERSNRERFSRVSPRSFGPIVNFLEKSKISIFQGGFVPRIGPPGASSSQAWLTCMLPNRSLRFGPCIVSLDKNAFTQTRDLRFGPCTGSLDGGAFIRCLAQS